jgi:hypothetical protein
MASAVSFEPPGCIRARTSLLPLPSPSFLYELGLRFHDCIMNLQNVRTQSIRMTSAYSLNVLFTTENILGASCTLYLPGIANTLKQK